MYKVYDIVIVGAGLSGSVIAERYATSGKKVLIVEKRDHIGGNCYDYVDDNGIIVNKYGAHLFHTNHQDVWEYINRFDNWVRWEHEVKANVCGKIVPIPVNITTVNKLLSMNLQDEDDMKKWLSENQVKYDKITNSEEMAKSRIGENLYDILVKYYTIKQWNKYPNELSPEILARIPVRDNYDTRYFSDKYQALPHKGYTHFFKQLLNHENIDIKLSTDFDNIKEHVHGKVIVYTGPIDHYFKDMPKLEYRSINFVTESYKNMNYYQANSVVNYPGSNVNFTRIVEYKHFLNQQSPHTTIVKEFSTDKGDPYYPVLNERNLELYECYKKMADKETINKVHFIGRLANYKYFNMDQAIKNALDYYDKHLK